MKKTTLVLPLLALFAGLGGKAQAFANPATVNLLSSGDYAALAKTGISTSGVTLIKGDIGIKPGLEAALTGFSQTMDVSNEFSRSIYVAGKIYAFDYAVPTPAKLNTAVLDMQAAYTDAAGRAADATGLGTPPGSIGGLTFVRGVYSWSGNVDISTDIYLSGSATDIFIFQISGNLFVPPGIHVNLTGGALPQNVFWQVAGNTTLQGNSVMQGSILCLTLIAMQNGAVLNGSALAQSAITLIGNAINEPDFAAALTESPTFSPTNSPTFTETGVYSPTLSPTSSPTFTETGVFSHTPSPTVSPSYTETGIASPTRSPTPTNTGSGSPTRSPTPSDTAVASLTRSPTPTITGSGSPSPSGTRSASPSVSPSPATGSATPTPSASTTGTPGPGPVTLGNADGYSVLAGSGISNTGNSSVDGYLGTFPITTESGYGTLSQACTNHGGDTFTQAAKTDLMAAYNDLSTRPSTTVPVELGGTTRLTGVYSQTSLQLTSGILTLDGAGDPNALFIFYTGISTLTTAAGGSMNLSNGAQAKNVYFVVGTSATLGAGSALKGTVIALQSITLVTGATVEGRILAINGAVTMDANTITTSTSALVTCGGGSNTPTLTVTTASGSATPSKTATASPSPASGSATFSPTPSKTATASPTAIAGSATFSPTPIVGSATFSPTPGTLPPAPPSGETYIYPSPARGDTATVIYVMRESGDVTLKFYNQTGRLVDTVLEPKAAGPQFSKVSVGKFAKGTYYYVLARRYASGAVETAAPGKFLVLN